MEELRVYDSPLQFWDDVAPVLKREEAKNSLCLGLSYLFRSNPADCAYQSALFQNGRPLGSLVVSKYQTNFNLLPSPISDIGAAKKLFDELQKSRIPVSGIVGEKVTATIYKQLFEAEGSQTKVRSTSCLRRNP